MEQFLIARGRPIGISLVGKMETGVEEKSVMQNTVAGVGYSSRTTVDRPYGKNIELGICAQ
ncbi:hypothetical protein BTUL_0076g00130 [Botrytis tulipae]|uniref:Uncharacterized protein n=1 Tax=Botrytis tulipae TaxID=87230 RepID=A0A4Z1ERN8_9HELO|nr:hypothetical protein BTUL_0076g00130 [Botrytis tulipae]